MKKATKLCAWILSAALLLMAIPFTVLTAAEVAPEELDVHVTFTGNTVDPLVYTYGGENIERNGGTTLGAHDYRGTIHFTADGGYAVFKTADNSPFVTQVRNYAASTATQKDTAVVLEVSPDGTAWTAVTPDVTTGYWLRPNGSPEGQLNRYTLSAIGAGNRYVRVRMTGSGATSALNYMRSVAFNVGQPGYTIDFSDSKIPQVSYNSNIDGLKAYGLVSYTQTAVYAIEASKSRFLVYKGDADLVFKTAPGSTFIVESIQNAKSMSFEVSATGADGTWTTPYVVSTYTNTNANTGGKHMIPTIGAANQFIKIKITGPVGDFTNDVRISKISFEEAPATPTYTVAATANDSALGTVAGAGIYEQGETVTLTATAATDSRFVKWTEGGADVSTANPYTFSATADRTLVAVFEDTLPDDLYTIDFSESKYANGSAVNYTALDEAGVVAYSTNYIYHAGSKSILPFHDGSYMVFRVEPGSMFRANAWRCGNAGVTFAVSPTGTVGSWTDIEATKVYSDVSTGVGYENWQIATVGAENQYVRMTFTAGGDWNNYNRLFKVSYVQATVVAPTTYTIAATANNGAFGTVSGAETYEENATVTLTATANNGYRFIKWTENGADVSTANPYTFSATADRTLVAVFEQVPIENLYTIDFSETKFVGSPNTSVNYEAFDEAGVLSYSTNIGYHPGSKSLLTMNNGAYLIFRTEPNSIFRANAWKAGNASITFAVSPTGTAGSWTEVAATKVYESLVGGVGSQNWQIDAIGAENQYVRMTFNAGGDWSNYGRLFSVGYIQATTPGPDMHTIAVAPNKNAYGSVAGGGSYIADGAVTLTATAFDGYRFVKWTEDGADVGTENPYVFDATAPRTLIAVFEVDPDGDIPATDTCLDFYSEYASSVAQAFMKENIIQPWQAGLCADAPGANIVYKMQKNSPVVAVYRIFDETDMRPVFYGSKDAKNWGEPLEYRTMPTPNPGDEHRMQYYIIDGIGEENVYLKIQCVDGSDFEGFAHFYVDLRELNFNANTDPSPYDKTLAFNTDNTALGGLYAFTPAKAVEQTIGRGVYLALDHLIGKESAEKVRLVVNVSPDSGFKAEFTVNAYAKALGLLPKLYGSKDGKTWTQLNADLFNQGETNGIYNYLMYMDPQAEDYNFFAFEFQQEKDYTGIVIEELDDYVSDCLNSAIMVTSMSWLSPETPAAKPDVDSGETDTGSTDSGDSTDFGDDSDVVGDASDSPQTGHALPAAALALLLVSAVAVMLSCKGKYRALFAKR